MFLYQLELFFCGAASQAEIELTAQLVTTDMESLEGQVELPGANMLNEYLQYRSAVCLQFDIICN